MAKTKHSTLSALIDSDTDDAHFIEAMPTPDSAAENKAPGKKGRGRPKAAPTKVTKTKAPARRTSGRLITKAKGNDVAPKGKRPALMDKTNQQHASETEEVDDFEQDFIMEDEQIEETVIAVKQSKVPPPKQKAAGRPKAVKEKTIAEETPQPPKVTSRVSKKRGPVKKMPPKPSPEKIVQETQEMMEVDGDDEEEEVEITISKPGRNVSRPRSQSRHRPNSTHRRRAGSASDTERSDPALRRKLGDLTKKYDTLHLKYQDLREIGLKEAERNVERIRKHMEEEVKSHKELVDSLKADLATQTALGKDSRILKKKLETQNTDTIALKAQLKQLTASLSEMQAENKLLSTKLAASRTAAASVESVNSKIPGSAIKSNGGIRLMGTAEAAQVAQAAQLKEDLYRDLTGLIVRSVTREPEEDVFDCLQTGRNGTLHFKLAAANEKSAESYDDAQCSYIPQLDPSRDKALIEILPDYLNDEITFPRPQAAKFYARVVKALTERLA